MKIHAVTIDTANPQQLATWWSQALGIAIANDFVAQFQSDMLGVPLLRPRVQETTALGAVYLAGLSLGFWESREQLAQLWQMERRFEPRMPVPERERRYRGWQAAVQAACAFHPEA